jgi:hypothetical protein
MTFRAFSTAAPKLVSKRRLYWRRAMLHNRTNAPSTTYGCACFGRGIGRLSG